MMQKTYPKDYGLKKLQMHRRVNRYQQTGSVEDTQHKHKNSGNSKMRLDVVKAQNKGQN